MRGNNFKEKKVVPLIFTQFWIRSHLNKLDRLTPQDVYYVGNVFFYSSFYCTIFFFQLAIFIYKVHLCNLSDIDLWELWSLAFLQIHNVCDTVHARKIFNKSLFIICTTLAQSVKKLNIYRKVASSKTSRLEAHTGSVNSYWCISDEHFFMN